MSLLLAQIGGGGAVTHSTSGALTGQGASVVGSASRLRAFATSGALTGQGSSIVGVAVHRALHSTSGALTGPGSALAGTAARFRAMSAVGVLVGPGSALSGTSARFHAFSSSGELIGPGSALSGSAARAGSAVSHDTSGTLAGQGSAVAGTAARSTPEPAPLIEAGDGVDPRKRKPREFDKKEATALREMIAKIVDPVKEAAPAEVAVVKEAKSVTLVAGQQSYAVPVPPKVDPDAIAIEVTAILARAGIAAKQAESVKVAREAFAAAQENMRLRTKRRREEELLLLL